MHDSKLVTYFIETLKLMNGFTYVSGYLYIYSKTNDRNVWPHDEFNMRSLEHLDSVYFIGEYLHS